MLHNFIQIDSTRFFALALAVILAYCAGTVQADTALLYSVERPVAAQSVAERQKAASSGLLEVLTRVTGLVSIPRTAEVNQALDNPDAFYSQFVFFTNRGPAGETENFVRLTFDADAIQGLVRQARLPVWWSQRPSVMVWLVVDDEQGREIIDAASTHPIVEALKGRAAQRGLPMTLPLMDLDDTLAISAADVWGKLAQTTDTAAQRYDADLVLVGRIRALNNADQENPRFAGDWEVWLDDRPLATNFNAELADQAAINGVDLLADRLAEQFAVLPRSARTQALKVGGVANPTSYASLMRFLTSLEFIDQVEVSAIDAQGLHLQITSRAETNQLLMLLTSNNRFVEDSFSRGASIRLLWQG